MATTLVLPPYMELEELINAEMYTASLSSSKAIMDAIDKGLPKAEILNILQEYDGNEYTLETFKENYLSSLQSCLKVMSDLEEYEECVIIQKYIQKLESNGNN